MKKVNPAQLCLHVIKLYPTLRKTLHFNIINFFDQLGVKNSNKLYEGSELRLRVKDSIRS